jgi:hypothetical protein
VVSDPVMLVSVMCIACVVLTVWRVSGRACVRGWSWWPCARTRCAVGTAEASLPGAFRF